MKTFKYLLCTFVAMAVGLASCSDDVEYTPGKAPSGQEVYFPENVTTMYSISDDVSSIAIPVNRVAKDEALTVPIKSQSENESVMELFTIPSTVTFAAGKETAELLITFDRTKLEDGKDYPMEFMIFDADNTTPYGNSMIKITVAPWPWESLGTGKFRDDWLHSMFSGGGTPEIDVKIHKHKSKKGMYMIEEMYGWPFLTEFFGGPKDAIIEQIGLDYTPTNIIIDCTNPQSIFMARQFTGITDLNPAYGNYEIAMFQGTSGTLEDGIITFQTGALAFVCKAGNLQGNKRSLFRIILPGYKAVDYSVSAAYGGMKVGADNKTTSAVIDFSYGNDVTGISYVFAAGDVTANADKIAAEIVAGTAKNVYEVKDFVKGSKTVSIEAEMAAGMYTVVALPKDDTGELFAEGVSATAFYFPGMSGGSAPECDINVMMGLVSEYWPEQSAKNPDTSSLYFELTGSELKSLSTWLTPTTNYNSLAQELTDEELADQFGTDRSATFMTNINSKGGYGSAWINLPDGTSFTLLVKAKNIYDESAVVKATFSTSAIPYTGELAIGEYYMSYVEEGGYSCENVFQVRPTAGSSTAFFVSGLGYTGATAQWYATYNPAAGTLTLDGKAKGYESNGNVFGRLSTPYDGAGLYTYKLLSFLDPEGEAVNDPLVFKVNASKQISELSTFLNCPLIREADKKKVADLSFFPIGTEVTPYTSGSKSAVTAASKQNISKKAPINSVRALTNSKSLLSNSIFSTANADFGKSYSYDNNVRTLSVKTAQCDPLPKKAGRVANFKESVNLPVMK